MTKLQEQIIEIIQKADKYAYLMPSEENQLSYEVEKICLEWIEKFKDWYDTLSPAEKCTIWPPPGSGGAHGLYNMETKEIVAKFMRHKGK